MKADLTAINSNRFILSHRQHLVDKKSSSTYFFNMMKKEIPSGCCYKKYSFYENLLWKDSCPLNVLCYVLPVALHRKYKWDNENFFLISFLCLFDKCGNEWKINECNIIFIISSLFLLCSSVNDRSRFSF